MSTVCNAIMDLDVDLDSDPLGGQGGENEADTIGITTVALVGVNPYIYS